MASPWSQPMMRRLQGVACVVIIMWGIRTASHLLVILLMALVFAYAFVPLPHWLMQSLRTGKTAALLLTLTLLGTLNVVTVTLLYDSVARMKARLPVYDERFMGLYEKVLVFANAHGINFANLSATKLSTSDKVLEFGRVLLQQASGFLGDGLLISVLAWVFLVEMVEGPGAKRNPLSEGLANCGGEFLLPPGSSTISTRKTHART